MPENILEPPTGTNGPANSGDGYGVSEFLSEAAAQPKIETPTYENNTGADGGTETNSDSSQANPAEGQTLEGTLKPRETAEQTPPQPKRTIQEIQAYRSAQTRARKFDGLADDEITLFKNMSQEAYNRLYPMFLDHKKSEERIKELETAAVTADQRRWYEEPNAYQLHPDYAAATATDSNLNTELSFWQEQLAAVEDNKPWNQLVYNDSNGKREYIRGEVQDPSSMAKAQILSNISQCQQYKSTNANRIANIQQNFAGKYKSYNDSLSNADKTMFGKLELDKNPELNNTYNEWLAQFPKEFRGQLPYQMLAKSAAVITGLVKKLRETEAGAVRRQAVKATVVTGGPSNGSATSASGKTGKDYERGFEELTRRRLS
jgi:hypothetical protein